MKRPSAAIVCHVVFVIRLVLISTYYTQYCLAMQNTVSDLQLKPKKESNIHVSIKKKQPLQGKQGVHTSYWVSSTKVLGCTGHEQPRDLYSSRRGATGRGIDRCQPVIGWWNSWLYQHQTCACTFSGRNAPRLQHLQAYPSQQPPIHRRLQLRHQFTSPGALA